MIHKNISLDYEAIAEAFKKKENRKKAKSLTEELNRRTNDATRWFNEEMRKLK